MIIANTIVNMGCFGFFFILAMIDADHRDWVHYAMAMPLAGCFFFTTLMLLMVKILEQNKKP